METSETTTFGELEVGDRIEGPSGELVTVARAYDAHLPERMYEIELEDGTVIEASGNHLWYIEPEADQLSHSSRLSQAKALLKPHRGWQEEALLVAEADKHYEIGFEDLMNFFDFIEDYDARFFLIKRVVESIGPIVEEEVTYRDYLTGEEKKEAMEVVYDARRAFQQLLSLSGVRRHRRRWPVLVGRVVTTDVLFSRYPDAELPTPKRG